MSDSYGELAKKVRANIDKFLEERKEHSDKILVIRSACVDEKRDPSEEEAATVRAAKAKLDELDETIEDLRGQVSMFEKEQRVADAMKRSAEERKEQDEKTPAAHARVTSEPSTYNARTAQDGVSFFRDLYSVQLQRGFAGAAERISRYEREMQSQQQRAVTTGSFGGLIPPEYLVDQAAIVAQAGRPTANIVQKLPLPQEGMQLVIPRGTTPAGAAVQPTENSTVANTDEVWANLTVPVITVAGQQDVSRQSLERGTPGIDAIIFADLAASYAVALDNQVLQGTGASGQALGILNTANIGAATAFGKAATAALVLSKVQGAIATVQETRFLPADVLVMHPRRWSWLAAQTDTAGRPFISTSSAYGAFNAIGVQDQAGGGNPTTATQVGTFAGLPVVLDANIPTAYGTGADEDVIVVARREDLMLWEAGDGQPTDLRFEQTLGNQLTVKLVAYGYSAFTAGRYPAAVALVGGADKAGSGLVAPTF
mgnify:CR=1 FL=1